MLILKKLAAMLYVIRIILLQKIKAKEAKVNTGFTIDILGIQVNENEVWVGSEKGVQVLHKEGGVWKTGEIHGGNSAELTLECNVSAASYNQWKDQVLFGTTKGLVVIERSEMKQDSYQGKVQIKRIDLFFNENTKWSEYSRNQKCPKF